jgi:hypothetical protein
LSVHRPAAGRSSGRPRASASPPAGPQRAFAATPAAEHDRARADSSARRIVLVDEDVDDRVLEAPGELAHGASGSGASGSSAQPVVGARLVDDPARRGLEAREAEVVRVAEPARGKTRVVRVRRSAARWIAGPPG